MADWVVIKITNLKETDVPESWMVYDKDSHTEENAFFSTWGDAFRYAFWEATNDLDAETIVQRTVRWADQFVLISAMPSQIATVRNIERTNPDCLIEVSYTSDRSERTLGVSMYDPDSNSSDYCTVLEGGEIEVA